MKAGVADHKWTIEEIVDLLPIDQPSKRGPYQKKNSNCPTTREGEKIDFSPLEESKIPFSLTSLVPMT
jgi:hypothetical protein